MWLQFCTVMDLKIGIFFNEVIGLGGGGEFQRKPDKKKVSCRV